MVNPFDVGSLPPRVDAGLLQAGATASQTLLPLLGREDVGEALRAFEEEVVGAFVDKLRAGMDTPNYPQFRDMNEMFIAMIRGVEKTAGGYVSLGTPSARQGARIPEVSVLRRNASKAADLAQVDRFRMKVCVTGPYTLASLFPHRDERLLEGLGRALAEITSSAIFASRRAEVGLLFIDEPVFGFLSDALLDYGAAGREALLGAWEAICLAASARGVETGIHLHNTSDNLFWEVDHLDIVESHVDDPLYASEATRRRLEETDKRLKASICVTDFDRLIADRLRASGATGDLQEMVARTWSEIKGGREPPSAFLEDPKLLQGRLRRLVERFGAERVPYAGPECGLKSFPTYDCALECLRRVSEAAKAI